ncbi:MAG: hypothetical protein WA807_08470 [Steroidobacteraceae bacterium]
MRFLIPPEAPWVVQVYVPAPHKTGIRRSDLLTAAFIALVLCCQCGCVATKYKLAKKDTPPVQPLNIAFPSSPPLQAVLATLIVYGGPGSWKREALWDEYVVTLENQGDRPLTIDSATLTDSAGTPFLPEGDPWALEKKSEKLEKQYRDRGEAFIRAAGPGVLIVGVGAATFSAAAGSTLFISAGVAGAALATVVVLPVYYASVLGINHHNKKAIMTEFNRRCLPLPLTLAPGETRTGSLFYPMVRSPRSLTLNWPNEAASAATVLPLDFLHALHVPAAVVDQAAQ